MTDHNSILGPKKGIPSLAAARLQRWSILLTAYLYDIEFKPTKDHSNTDGLSQLPLKDEMIEYHSPEPSNFYFAQINSLPVTNHEIQVATRTDPILSKVYQYTKKGWPNQVP